MSERWIALALLLASPPAWAGEERSDQRIDRVVVFADRAEVTRVRVASCSDGKGEVEFSMLPSSIDERTLRAEASGRARAIGASSRVVPVGADQDTRKSAVQAELDKVRDRIREMRDGMKKSRERAALAGGYGAYFRGILDEDVRSAKPATDSWKRALDVVRGERLEAQKSAAHLAVELRKLERTEGQLVDRMAVLEKGRAPEARWVTVAIDCGQETRPEVRLSYVVPAATWHPEYDVRFQPDGDAKLGRGHAELVIAAVVQQSTGEDWTNAQILLSTAKPKLGVEAPYPAPLYVEARETTSERVMVQGTERREQLKEAVKAPAAAATAQIEDGGNVFSLTLPHRATVLSDARPYWMPVDVVKTSAEAKLVAIPKLRPHVYQVAELVNAASFPLPAGRAHIYRRGSYVGDTTLDYKAPSQPIEISLGIDDEIAVERKDVTEVNKGPGFLSVTKSMERAYRLRVQNRAASRVTIEVRENIPVSKSKEIKVVLVPEKTSPTPKIDAERGFLSWEVALDRGQSKAIDLSYVIKLPSNWEVR
jgi:uncharacterized protein (TIGR02231 family)